MQHINPNHYALVIFIIYFEFLEKNTFIFDKLHNFLIENNNKALPLL